MRRIRLIPIFLGLIVILLISSICIMAEDDGDKLDNDLGRIGDGNREISLVSQNDILEDSDSGYHILYDAEKCPLNTKVPAGKIERMLSMNITKSSGLGWFLLDSGLVYKTSKGKFIRCDEYKPINKKNKNFFYFELTKSGDEVTEWTDAEIAAITVNGKKPDKIIKYYSEVEIYVQVPVNDNAEFVADLEIKGSYDPVCKGTSRQYTAEVYGNNDNVIWSVENSSSTNTTIDETGLLNVAEDEGSNTIVIKATSEFNNRIYYDREIKLYSNSQIYKDAININWDISKIGEIEEGTYLDNIWWNDLLITDQGVQSGDSWILRPYIKYDPDMDYDEDPMFAATLFSDKPKDNYDYGDDPHKYFIEMGYKIIELAMREDLDPKDYVVRADRNYYLGFDIALTDENLFWDYEHPEEILSQIMINGETPDDIELSDTHAVVYKKLIVKPLDRPASTKLTKLNKGHKSIKVKWKKGNKKINGYQIQVSTKKNFKSGKKTVNVKGYKTTSKTIKKLKARKKYYVRIRTYVTKNGNNYYSSWSKVKNIKTR